MSFDIKYRPIVYSDVIGQDTTIKILKKIVESGKGFHQSYLMIGPYGSGKTTLARILARALLCKSPKDGEPCDACSSCVGILKNGHSECLTEIDAATNSGKDSMRQMIESLSYATFSGGKRLFIFDESHMLSRDALDSLLIPLEDTSYGTEDRRMVCIFCTTEPEKMRDTIGSRCGPVFSIRASSPEDISKKLETICRKENIKFEQDAILEIAERSSGHVRDAVKTLETLSMLGGATSENIHEYFGADNDYEFLEIIDNIGKKESIELVEKMLKRMPPSSVYLGISKWSILSFQESNGMTKSTSGKNRNKMLAVGSKMGRRLLDISERFSNRPKRSTREMILCDMLSLYKETSIGDIVPVVETCKDDDKAGTVSCEVELPTNKFATLLNSKIGEILKKP